MKIKSQAITYKELLVACPKDKLIEIEVSLKQEFIDEHKKYFRFDDVYGDQLFVLIENDKDQSVNFYQKYKYSEPILNHIQERDSEIFKTYIKRLICMNKFYSYLNNPPFCDIYEITEEINKEDLRFKIISEVSEPQEFKVGDWVKSKESGEVLKIRFIQKNEWIHTWQNINVFQQSLLKIDRICLEGYDNDSYNSELIESPNFVNKYINITGTDEDPDYLKELEEPIPEYAEGNVCPQPLQDYLRKNLPTKVVIEKNE